MKYKVGDLVRIKTWEQMESEFGVTLEGDIPCHCYFTSIMSYLCGTVQEIELCDNREDCYRILGDVWVVSDDMIEGLAFELTTIPVDIFPENDSVNHPSHYCQEGSMECIDEMVAVFGKEAVMNFCLCNVWKYRKRALHKNGEEDLKKSDWYMKKYIELKGEL